MHKSTAANRANGKVVILIDKNEKSIIERDGMRFEKKLRFIQGKLYKKNCFRNLDQNLDFDHPILQYKGPHACNLCARAHTNVHLKNLSSHSSIHRPPYTATPYRTLYYTHFEQRRRLKSSN